MSKEKQLEIIPPKSTMALKPLLKPLYSPDEMIAFQKDVTALITKALVQGQDYGSVPGIAKPFLFKSGAERLCKAFGCIAHYDIVASEINYDIETKIKTKYEVKTVQGRFSYTIRCNLKTTEDRIIGDGIGLASTTEKKFSYGPCDNHNTVLKMAQKRALVGAVLNAFGLSDRFTQDEDTITTVPSKSVEATNVITSAPQETTKTKGYEPSNSAHRLSLIKALEERQIPDSYWQTIGDKLTGRSITDLEAVISEVVVDG